MRILTVSSVALALLAISCTKPYERSVCDSSSSVVDQAYVHKYGVELEKQDWQQRGQNGQVVSKLKNGVTVTKSYNLGMLEGDTTYTFPYSAAVEKKETYFRNALMKTTLYYSSGAPLQQTDYHERKSKDVTEWYENGLVKSVEKYDVSGLLKTGEYYTRGCGLDGKVEDFKGVRVNHDQYGQVISKDDIQSGEVVVKVISHPNGAPKEIIPYHLGVIEGTRKTYSPDGEPLVFEEWKNGMQNGIMTIFQNGGKVAEVSYVNGRKSGIERRFCDDLAVAEEITWVDDMRHGPSCSYINECPSTEWYYQGKLVSKGNFDLLNNGVIQPRSSS